MSLLPVVVTNRLPFLAGGVLHGGDLEALHRGLQGVDRVDLGDDHAAAVGAAGEWAQPLPTSP